MSNIFLLPMKIRHLDSLFEKKVNEYLTKEVGITASQFMILFGVFKCDGLSQKTIASHLKITESAVSRQIENMVKVGYLERQVNPDNRREHILGLTTKGRKVFIEAEESLLEMEEKFLQYGAKKKPNNFEIF
ncbi:winged helix-turn-helix transcriptional regulator [Candidatus Gracilibacteria bacterium]|nr:winged helix-turn-helix transcriptional regulator [Candidatus Gracilibacteria bacterium]